MAAKSRSGIHFVPGMPNYTANNQAMETNPQPVTIVTGAGSGIGLETASCLASRGHRIVLVGRRREPLVSAAARIGPGVAHVVARDVGEAGAGAAIVVEALDRFGRLDHLVNAAGWAPRHPVPETDEATIRAAFAVNAVGPACLAAAAFAVMSKQPDGLTRRIVQVSSRATIDPFDGFFAYAASKASMNLASMVIDREGQRLNGCTVRSVALVFGAVETGMLRAVATRDDVPLAMSASDAGRFVADVVEGRLDAEEVGSRGFEVPGP